MTGPNLHINDLIEWPCEPHGHRIQRVLAIVPEVTQVVLIVVAAPSPQGADGLVRDRRAMPVWIPFSILADALSLGDAQPMMEDPFAAETRPDTEISASRRERRDRRWHVIAPLVAPDQGSPLDVLRPETRGPLVTAAALATDSVKDAIYDWLRLYWQHGQTPNALLAGYDRSGAPGKQRRAGTAKRGRKSRIAKAFPDRAGINITEAVQRLLVQGGKRYYEKRKLRLKDAYQRTMEHFFRVRLELRDGAVIPILPPAHEMPTFRQFCFWFGKARDMEREIKARHGARRFNQQHRVVTGTSEHLSKGPGDVYMIDATVGDIHLLSSLDPTRVIGRPVIYLVLDHWSHMIVGLYVGLEGPSWMGAQMALHNAFSDKVEFCARYGRVITDADWPVHHLPRTIMADRGPEFLGTPSEQLVTAFQLGLANVPSWRPDYKSLVEGQFRISNETGIHWQPGAVRGPRMRGDPDPRLDALHTIESFTRLMIDLILWNNNGRPLGDNVPVGVPLPADGDPAAIDLWDWGVENRLGLLRRVGPRRAYIDLLPTSAASVTEHGIYITDLRLRYTSDSPRIQQMLIRNTGRKRPELVASYERRDVSRTYLRLDEGRTLEELVLTTADARFSGMTWEEVLDFKESRRLASALGRGARAQSRAELNARLDANRDEREREREAALGAHGKPQVEYIRDARRRMRNAERSEEAARWGSEEPQFVPANDPSDDDDYVPYPD
jgi:hypothetical protein